MREIFLNVFDEKLFTENESRFFGNLRTGFSLLDYANEHQRSMSAVSEYRQMALKGF